MKGRVGRAVWDMAWMFACVALSVGAIEAHGLPLQDAQGLQVTQGALAIAIHSRLKQNKKPNAKQNPNDKKYKTVFVGYWAGDNDLSMFLDVNRRQLERIGSDDDLALLLFMSTHKLDEGKLSTKALVQKNKTVALEKIPNLDSGSAQTVQQALEWALTYLADDGTLVIDFWDHGDGPLNRRLPRRGVCYDDTTGHYLTDVDLRAVFSRVLGDRKKRVLGKKKLEVVVIFDACLMASVEYAAALAPYANYMVASEQTVPGLGLPYHLVLSRFKRSSRQTKDFAHAVVDAYKEFYGTMNIPDYTFSCVDLSQMDGLSDFMARLTIVLHELLKKEKGRSVSKAMRSAIMATPRFHRDSFVDLGDWLARLNDRLASCACINDADTQRLIPQLKALLKEGKTVISHAVTKAVQGVQVDRATGLFVYLPLRYVDPSYMRGHWAKTTKWPLFLQTFCAGVQ